MGVWVWELGTRGVRLAACLWVLVWGSGLKGCRVWVSRAAGFGFKRLRGFELKGFAL